MQLTVPDPSLVLLIGPSGSGKSTFAARTFPPTAVLSSDELRRLLADDPNDQSASADAFRVLALLVDGRLGRRLLTVVDATNLRAASRRRWLGIARRYGLPAIAICFDLPLASYLELNRRRPGRLVEEWVVREQSERMATALSVIPDEGFASVHLLHTPSDVQATAVELVRAPS